MSEELGMTKDDADTAHTSAIEKANVLLEEFPSKLDQNFQQFMILSMVVKVSPKNPDPEIKFKIKYLYKQVKASTDRFFKQYEELILKDEEAN